MQLSTPKLSSDEQKSLLALTDNAEIHLVINNLGKEFLMAGNFTILGDVIQKLFPKIQATDQKMDNSLAETKNPSKNPLHNKLKAIHQEGLKILDTLKGCDFVYFPWIEVSEEKASKDSLINKLTPLVKNKAYVMLWMWSSNKPVLFFFDAAHKKLDILNVSRAIYQLLFKKLSPKFKKLYFDDEYSSVKIYRKLSTSDRDFLKKELGHSITLAKLPEVTLPTVKLERGKSRVFRPDASGMIVISYLSKHELLSCVSTLSKAWRQFTNNTSAGYFIPCKETDLDHYVFVNWKKEQSSTISYFKKKFLFGVCKGQNSEIDHIMEVRHSLACKIREEQHQNSKLPYTITIFTILIILLIYIFSHQKSSEKSSLLPIFLLIFTIIPAAIYQLKNDPSILKKGKEHSDLQISRQLTKKNWDILQRLDSPITGSKKDSHKPTSTIPAQPGETKTESSEPAKLTLS